jgi:hypothetical protein
MTSEIKTEAPGDLRQITFGRKDWTKVTGTPQTHADHLVRTGQLRSFKVGRLRCFFYSDVQALFERLATGGE